MKVAKSRSIPEISLYYRVPQGFRRRGQAIMTPKNLWEKPIFSNGFLKAANDDDEQLSVGIPT